jgi:hypothetical protein
MCARIFMNPDAPKPSNPAPPTDAQLIKAVRAGQTQALETIYERYASTVYGIALQILQDPQEAQDVSQDVFTTLWRTNAYNSERGALASYLAISARSRAVDPCVPRPANCGLPSVGVVPKSPIVLLPLWNKFRWVSVQIEYGRLSRFYLKPNVGSWSWSTLRVAPNLRLLNSLPCLLARSKARCAWVLLN